MGLTLGRTAISHFLSQVAVSASGFVATFAIARILGAEGVGIYALGMSLVVWLNVPLSGFQEALTKRLSEGIEMDSFFSAGLALNLLAVVVPAVLIVVASGPVNTFVGANVAGLIAMVLVTNGLFNTVRDTLHGEQKVARAGWLRTSERLLRTVFQIGLLVLGYQVAGLFVGHAIALVGTAILGFLFVDVRPVLPKRVHFRRLYEYARYGWSGGLKGNAFNWMDTIVLGLFVSTSLVGIYRVAWTLSSFLVVVSNSVSSTLFPELSELGAANEYARVHHFLEEGLVFTGVFLIPGFFGVLAIGEDLLRIYDPAFTQGANVLALLVLAQLLHAYAAQIISTLKALDRPDIALRIDLFFVAINLVLNLILVSEFGWYGAAVATLLSGGIILAASYRALGQLHRHPSIPYRQVIAEIGAGLVMFGCLLVLDTVVPSGHYATIVLVAVGALVYVAILLSISTRIRQKAVALVPNSLLST